MSRKSLKEKLHEVIFEADTRLGKIFDFFLLTTILLSILTVMLDSVETIEAKHGKILHIMEWFFTILFTAEYALRIFSVRRARGYIFSFYGLIDLAAILPTYIGLFIPGGQFMLILRILRFMRIFRILKLSRYVKESRVLFMALRMSMPKITVFLVAVLTIVSIMGAMMYLIEGKDSGFSSIPRGIYWAIVTITTVGYGDIAPRSAFGQALSAVLMVIGYGIIAVPTGIVSAQLVEAQKVSTQVCPFCGNESNDVDAHYCKKCGGKL